MNLNGFQFSRVYGRGLIKCSDVNSFFSKLMLIVWATNEEFGPITETQIRCKEVISHKTTAIISILASDDKASTIRDLRKNNIISKKEARVFVKIKKQVEANRINFNPWTLLEKHISMNRKKLSDFESRSSYFQSLRSDKDKINKIPINIWRGILDLSIALKVSNKAWMDKSMEKILNSSPYEIALSWKINKNFMKQKEKHLLSKVFDEYLNVTKNQKKTRLTTNKITLFDNHHSIKDFSNQYGGDWSLNSLRKETTNKKLIFDHFDFWYIQLLSRTNDIELNRFLRDTITIKNIKEIPFEKYWIFENYIPRSNIKRKVIVSNFQLMWNSDDEYLRYNIIKVLSNEVWRKQLILKDKKFEMALFQIERLFYKNLLKTSSAIDFAIYNLFRLGDKDDHHLYYLLF